MKILLPTDFSNDSLKAISYAMELFGEGHHWTLLHCYHTPHAGAGMLVKIDDILSGQSKEDIQAFQKKVHDKFGSDNYPTVCRSEHGEVVQVLDILAKEEEYELIAMGTTGASGLKEALFGSVASKVIEHAPLPVLAVPARAEFNGLDRVAIADDEEQIHHATMPSALQVLISMHEPELKMVHVTKDADKSYSGGKGFDRLFANTERTHHVVHNTNVSEGLQSFNREQRIDMVVMLHRRGSGFMEWLTVSTSEDMAMHVRVPLLVFRD